MDTTAFYNLLLDKLTNDSLDELIRTAAEFTGQSVVLLDSGYKVLASWPHKKIGDPYWDAQQEYGYVPEENLRKIFESKCPDATFKGPAYIDWNDVVYPRSAASIIHNGLLLGHVSIYHTDSDKMQEDELQAACSCLERVLKIFFLNNNHLSTASTTVMSALVSRIFAGQHINREFLDEWKNLCGDELKGSFAVVTVSQQKLHKSILDLISARLGNIHRYFAYAEIDKYGYILFYNVGSDGYFQSIMSRLRDYLYGYKLHCGVSELFDSIDNIRFHMYQSRKALKIGQIMNENEPLHAYGKLRTDIILSYVCESMDYKNYVHPLFTALKAEDEENGTQYYRTLISYLDCICDSAKAAKKLFIHRNTLLYRINRIEENYNCSMEDEAFVRDLMLSHMICDFRERMPACEISQKDERKF